MTEKMNEQTKIANFNELHFSDHTATPSTSEIPSPNADTLYTQAWIDLRAEEMVLSVPAITDRFQIWEFLDFETNIIGGFSPRTWTGGALNIIVSNKSTQPQSLPQNGAANVVIYSYSPVVWLVGRTLVQGEADLENALKVEKSLTLDKLSTLVGVAPHALDIDYGPLEAPALRGDTADDFFRLFGWALATMGVPAQNASLVQKWENIGISTSGQTPKDSGIRRTLAWKIACTRVLYNLQGIEFTRQLPPWSSATKIGKFGQNFLLRATVAEKQLAGNVAEDAMYQVQSLDSHLRMLNGTHSYVWDLKEALPVHGFWSITAQNSAHYFEKNSIDRYSLSSVSDGLVKNSAGGALIYLSHSEPEDKSRLSNWLPVPQGEFNLIVRTQWPEASLINLEIDIPQLVQE